jgi:CheY-like chemotaxis protein/HPt (histidine-containing phosphotransfer) domain-containing protein
VQLIPDAVLVNGNPLIRTSLIQSIAIALGKVSASIQATVADHADDTMELLSRDREEAAGRLILLAEDNPTNRELISRQLARLGYLCDIAEDGARAWKMLKSGAARYALLLTDCHMPRLDGYELTRRIRTHERGNGGPYLPIVAITANALQGEGERCLDIGMNGYLAKPLQIRDLKRALAELLPAPITGLIATDSETASKSTCFRELADILGGDEERLRHVLGVFERSTRNDCDLLDAAYAARDRKRVRELAHKLKSGCSQLGEDIAAQELETLEIKTKGDAKFDDEFAAARRELQQVLRRVSAHLGAE